MKWKYTAARQWNLEIESSRIGQGRNTRLFSRERFDQRLEKSGWLFGRKGAAEHIVYRSPSVGPVTFGWTIPLKVAGTEIPLDNYPRFDNPYCNAEFSTRRVEIRHDEMSRELDFESADRQ